MCGGSSARTKRKTDEDDDEEHEQRNDAKQIPGQETNVRRANPADPSGSSY
jgi:hypothetical protein